MSEYIDKDALYKEILLLENCKRELAEEKEIDEYAFLKRQQVLEVAIYYKQFVANFPTADVAPVVHGKWKCLDGSQKHYCSVCGMDFDLYACVKKLFNYCPNCGARCDI